MGEEQGGHPVVREIVVVDHIRRAAAVEITKTGAQQLCDHDAARAGMRVLGWCHSHHTALQAIASVADLRVQCNYQSLDPNFLMVILWQKGVAATIGMTVQLIEPSRLQELKAHGGVIDASLGSMQKVAEYLQNVPVESLAETTAVEVVDLRKHD